MSTTSPSLFKSSPPREPALKPYVDAIHLFDSGVRKDVQYLAFPHTNTGLSFFRGAALDRDDHRIWIRDGGMNDHPIEILGKYTGPVWVSYIGHFEEVSIIFKPLGVNRFLRRDFATLAPLPSQPLLEPDWTGFASELFKSPDRISCLEAFLCAQLHEDVDVQRIESTLSLLTDPDMTHPLVKIASQVNMSIKTYQRHFQRFLACTPMEYRRIARFRNVLNSRVDPRAWKTLTSLSHEHQFSDQSHFIREFQKLTGQNPRSFFRKAKAMDGEKVIWEIL